MKRYAFMSLFTVIFASFLAQGCSKEIIGGAAIGAAGVGAAYEYQNKRQMDKLEDDFEAGRITKDEYYERKRQIESGSLIY